MGRDLHKGRKQTQTGAKCSRQWEQPSKGPEAEEFIWPEQSWKSSKKVRSGRSILWIPDPAQKFGALKLFYVQKGKNSSQPVLIHILYFIAFSIRSI